MSMYPSPYQPPGVPNYYAAPPDPLAPAKRASLLMFIVGPLTLLMGTCLFSFPSIMNRMHGPEADQMRQQLQQQAGGDLDQALLISGVLALSAGLAMLILAFFVRRGGRTACVLGTVLAGLLTLNCVGSLARSLFMANIPAVCMLILLVALFAVMLVWLIQAIRAAGNVHLAKQQYAAQYWQYQQTMQAYANTGYGYGVQPSAQTPPPVLPPAPALPPGDPQNPTDP